MRDGVLLILLFGAVLFVLDVITVVVSQGDAGKLSGLNRETVGIL